MADLPRATVVRRKDFTGELFSLWLKPEIPFLFTPGQYCTIGLVGSDGKRIERPYSIVSAPQEELLELFIELIHPPQGVLTPLLHRLREGDEVSIRPRAKGVFTLEPAWRNHIMVATVTGIVPYVSMLREAILRGDAEHRFFVLQGASYFNEFAYDDELQDMEREMQGVIQVEYVPTVSRPFRADDAPENQKKGLPNKDWQGETGRVNEILEKHIERWRLQLLDSIIYVCGHPGMIEDVKARFGPKGWKVKEERFFK